MDVIEQDRSKERRKDMIQVKLFDIQYSFWIYISMETIHSLDVLKFNSLSPSVVY